MFAFLDKVLEFLFFFKSGIFLEIVVSDFSEKLFLKKIFCTFYSYFIS